jgi:hypothetical protein
MTEKFPAIAAVIAKYPPERKLGRGAYKWVYASGKVAVAITEYEKQAKDEIRYLARLRDIGLPVVEVLKWVPAGKLGDGGAIVMRRYRKAHKITQKIRDRCVEIAGVLKKHRLYVTDLHVLLDKWNGVVLADPLWIKRRIRGDTQEFKFPDHVDYCKEIYVRM